MAARDKSNLPVVAGTGVATAVASVVGVPRVMTTPGYARMALQVLLPVGAGLFLRRSKRTRDIGNGLLLGGAAAGAYIVASRQLPPLPGSRSGTTSNVPPGTLTLPGYTPSPEARTLGLDGPEPTQEGRPVQSTPTIRVGSTPPSRTRTNPTTQRPSSTPRPAPGTPAPAPAPTGTTRTSTSGTAPLQRGPTPPASLGLGSFSQRTAYAQALLARIYLGFQPPYSGYYDSYTRGAVLRFQRERRLLANGELTQETLATLEVAGGGARIQDTAQTEGQREIGDPFRGEPLLI